MVETIFAIVLFTIVGIVVVGGVLAYRHHQQAVQSWRDYAARHALAYAEDDLGPRLEGPLRGRPFRLFRLQTTEDGDTVTKTRAVLEPRPPLPDGLWLGPRTDDVVSTALARAAEAVARRAGRPVPPVVPLAEPAFDARWEVRGFDAAAVRAWMASPQRRQALLELLAEPDLDTEGTGIAWTGTMPRSEAAIDAVVRRLEGFAERLESDR